MTIGSPNQANASPTSPDSNGRRMSRLVSIVARTGCYPCATDKSCSWLGFLSKIASLSEESIFVFEFVSFYYFQSAKQTLSLPGVATRRAHCTVH